jgi:hypothetical protein
VELAQPTNTTDPTKQCVVLTGRPIFDANKTVNAAPSSIVNPLELEVKQLNNALDTSKNAAACCIIIYSADN